MVPGGSHISRTFRAVKRRPRKRNGASPIMRVRHGHPRLALHAEIARAATAMVEGVDFEGIAKTRAVTLLDLLPHPPPASFTDAEIGELERRIDNLAIFDEVKVERRGVRIHVLVREKWTLIPTVDFASGETLADTYAMLGITEYNAFGTANQAAVKLSHEQRGWGVQARYEEHVQRPRELGARHRVRPRGHRRRETAGRTSCRTASVPRPSSAPGSSSDPRSRSRGTRSSSASSSLSRSGL